MIDARFTRWLPLALVALAFVPMAGVGQAPDENWRTLPTEHFRITFPAGMEDLARRAGDRAERAYANLSATLIDPPNGRLDVLLTDHADFSNGFANALPYNHITVFARPPMEGFDLAYFDDWMEIVITHELTHIFHLDHTGWMGSVARRLFGRVSASWPTFPAFAVPGWVTEGIATYYESALTESGRVRGSAHDMALRTAVLEGRLDRLDQISGRSPNWPAGDRIYIYGAAFFNHLSEEYGQERLGEFVHSVANQLIPYRLDSGAKDSFGVGFSEAFRRWVEEMKAGYSALADSLAGRAPITHPERLTTGGRQAFYAQLGPGGGRLAFVRRDGRSDTQLRVASPDGLESRKLTRTNDLSNFTWLRDGSIVAAELEFTDRYRIRSDLVHIDEDGRERRVTSGARLDQPSASPDGRYVVAVQDGGGTNRLVLVELSSGSVEPLTDFVADRHWAYPRWSPDGRWIAASMWSPGAFYDLVLLRPDGRIAQRITRDRAVDLGPTWSPDSRWLVWASDRSGIPNLYAVEVDGASGEPGPLRQVTNVLTGVSFPTVDGDGEWIYVSGYHPDGWEVERLPFRPSSFFEPFPIKKDFAEGGEGADGRFARRAEGEIGPYRPLKTLLPRFWEPLYRQGVDRRGFQILKPSYGVGTDGVDLVGRHAYSASIRFRTTGRTDAVATYSYAGLGDPVLSLSYSQNHNADGPFGVETSPDVVQTVFLAERERRVRASVSFRRQRVRSAVSLTLSGGHIWETLGLLDQNLNRSEIALARPDRRLAEGSATLAFSTARSYAYSMTPERGVSGIIQGRVRTELSLPDSLSGAKGLDRSFQDVIGRLSAFTPLPGPGFSRHVIAVRMAGGIATGPGADAFHFDIGGASGRPEGVSGLELFGGVPLFFPVRGFLQGERFGRYAWTASIEYRLPLLNINRGLGLVPFHMDRTTGSLFFDAGNAWGPFEPQLGLPRFENPRRSAIASVGAELSAKVVAFWTSDLTVRFGVALPVTDNGKRGNGLVGYVRVGRAF
ncbi:MAG: hypothetical protein BMS9Abin29_2050 [Gemmatimonadota bacterium]|nr:MAG: hypothetical protein BMS9Abin29_2050 [Gemmatimonadota bacterium]